MVNRGLALAAVLPLLAAAACSHTDVTGLEGFATVRFINATNTNIDVTMGGLLVAGNNDVSFGEPTSCMAIDVGAPELSVKIAGTNTTIPGFIPTFQAGGTYSVMVSSGANGVIQFTTLSDAFTPFGGEAGFRAFNAAISAGIVDVYVTPPGVPLTLLPSASGLAFGTSTNFINVNPGTNQVRFTMTGTKTVLLDTGDHSFFSLQNYTTVLGPPMPGESNLRSFTLGSC
jgi:Domain of unknown function (DUF4397)